MTGREPPLTPALGKSLQIQLSIPDDPPSYSQVDRTLAPDIVPLPDVGALKIDIAKEGIHTHTHAHTHLFLNRYT